QTGISSNGTAFSSDVIEKVFESDHDYIIFAFDGASKETYEKIRLGASR
ncbi:MAG: radical SAM protein, partial [Nitrospina sp.]|nr:radical SAM protein [Nitrospina sp.]